MAESDHSLFEGATTAIREGKSSKAAGFVCSFVFVPC
jgi:hypothetical protein